MVITGASSGLGRHLALHFSSKGYSIAAIARSKDKLDALAEEAAKGGGSPVGCYQCDVANKDAVRATVASILADMGPIEVLINNAAAGHDGKPFWELSLDDVDRCIDVNLKVGRQHRQPGIRAASLAVAGSELANRTPAASLTQPLFPTPAYTPSTQGTMYVTLPILKSMVERDRGRIIAIASVAGTWGIPNESCYVASKHGMVGFMDSIANETRSTKVCTSTICPGGIDTPWWTKDHPYGEDHNHADGTTKDLIQTQEIVDLVEFQLGLPTNRVLKRFTFFPKGEWH